MFRNLKTVNIRKNESLYIARARRDLFNGKREGGPYFLMPFLFLFLGGIFGASLPLKRVLANGNGKSKQLETSHLPSLKWVCLDSSPATNAALVPPTFVTIKRSA